MNARFDRGTELTIFTNDRMEDIVALLLALFIALLVYLFV